MKYLFTILISLFSISAYSQWQVQKAAIVKNLQSITFSTDSIGFACTGDSLEITLNGGKNWKGTQFFTENHLQKVSFISPQYGFILSFRNLFRTTDGGINWTKLALDFFPDQVYFVNPAIGFLAEDNRIETTTDSGKTWSQYKLLPMSTFGGALHFINADLGFMPGEGGYTVIQDTGKSLTFVRVDAHSDFKAVQFPSAKTGYIAGILDTAIVLKTTDSGKTWRSSCAGININVIKESINDIHFINADTGYACGTRGLIFVTTDGGKSWQKQESNTKRNLTSMYFRSPKNIYIIGDSGTIIHTTDGGFGKSEIEEKIEPSASFKVYPNPTSDVLHLNGNEMMKRISVENTVGQELYGRQVSAVSFDLFLNDFSHTPGLYIVKIQTSSQLYSYKVLLNN